jgi:carotenoid cleavage dioxygenase-like enzyme
MTIIDDSIPTFLRGNGRPVTEERTLHNLAVKGTLPPELNGRYVRNGANPFTGMASHPFFGDGMIHGIRLRDGNAEWYRNRYVQTPFMANPDLDILDPAVMMDMTSSKANTHVIGHSGNILALEEGHFPFVLDGDLNTVGPTDFGGKLTGSFTAHPKICPVTGELLAFGYSPFEPYLRYLRVSADGQLVQSEDITVGGPTMMHDFNITQNHVIFMDLPAVFDLDRAIRGEMPIAWSDTYPARLGVMPRTGTDADVRWYDINPCYVFHPMNSYEDGTNIVLDVARLSHVWRESMMDFPNPELWRFTIDTVTGKVREEQVDDRPAEFPRVPDSKVGQPHRYGYMTCVPEHAASGDPTIQDGALIKHDRHTGVSTALELGRGVLPGEAVFVPADGATAEDQGYLMTYVYDSSTDSSRFIVVDATTMSSDLVASVELPRVPFGFHGSWVDASVVN